jgi:hypothetical protein
MHGASLAAAGASTAATPVCIWRTSEELRQTGRCRERRRKIHPIAIQDSAASHSRLSAARRIAVQFMRSNLGALRTSCAFLMNLSFF